MLVRMTVPRSNGEFNAPFLARYFGIWLGAKFNLMTLPYYGANLFQTQFAPQPELSISHSGHAAPPPGFSLSRRAFQHQIV